MPLPANILPPPSGDDVTSLIQRAKLQEMVPNSDVTFSDSDIIVLMNQELMSTIVPLVQSAREEYMVVTRDYQFPAVTGTVNVQNFLEIPDEATGLRLRDVYVIDSQGNFGNLPRLSPEQVASNNPGFWGNLGTSYNGYGGFYLQGNRLYLYPYSIASNQAMRLTFTRRPASLISTSGAAQIQAIVGDSVVVGPTVGQFIPGQYVAFIKNAVPHDYVTDLSATQSLYSSPVGLDAVPITTVSGSTLTFDPAVVASLNVGDWMTPYGTSPFAQFIPQEASNCLVQITAVRLLEALGDRDGQNMAIQKYTKMAKDLLDLITPRVDGKAKKVTNPNSLFRATRLGNWRAY